MMVIIRPPIKTHSSAVCFLIDLIVFIILSFYSTILYKKSLW